MPHFGLSFAVIRTSPYDRRRSEHGRHGLDLFASFYFATQRKEDVLLKLSQREVCTLLAALLYWQEETVPHGRHIMRPYFRQLGFPHAVPLNRRELARLSDRLQKQLSSPC